MERFIFEVIEPFLPTDLEQDRRKERVLKIGEELRAFVKGEMIPINKELAKKTRELFVASSDIETFKQKMEGFEKLEMKLRSQLAFRENELVRQKVVFQRDIQELTNEIERLKRQLKQTLKKNQSDIEKLNYEWRDKMTDTKRQIRGEHQKQLQSERKQHEQEGEQQRESFAVEKATILQESSKERAKIIKKYEEKIYNLKNESEESTDKLTKQFSSKIDELKEKKNQLVNKLSMEELNVRRLTLELEREVSQHTRFQSQFEATFKELQSCRNRHQEEIGRVLQDLQSTKQKMKQNQKNLSIEITTLKSLLKNTIDEKDKKFTDTVDELSTEHRVQVDTLRNNLMQERQITLSSFEVKAYEEMFQQIKKYQRLNSQFAELKDSYNTVKNSYEKRIKEMESEHESELATMEERKEYERQLSGENAKRQFNNLHNKAMLESNSLKNQHLAQMENLQRKYQEQKIALSNKLISQYEGMLADQRSNTEIQLKQKFVENERKAKAYEKRVAESEKRKSELKVVIERMKIESQMKIQSMMEANERLESQIEELHERIIELEKTKSTLINDYEFQLLLLNNQIQKIKDDSRQREDDLRANLNQRIVVKNKEIAKLAEKIKLETEQLIRRNKIRTNALQKEYEELKRVINQRTSLPEDIEALKVFHAAFQDRQRQLLAERKMREELQRELHSKDAIQKVFATKQAFKRLTVIDKMAQTGSKFLRGGRAGQTYT